VSHTPARARQPESVTINPCLQDSSSPTVPGASETHPATAARVTLSAPDCASNDPRRLRMEKENVAMIIDDESPPARSLAFTRGSL
jgi:hypothetical protein